MGNLDVRGQECWCGSPDRWLNDPSTPVEFDPRLNEYHLTRTRSKGHWVIRYCFFCGGTLPLSSRDQLFTKPAEEEAAEARGLLKGAKNLHQVLDRLGPPDRVFDAPRCAEGRPGQHYRQQLDYRSRWKSLDLFVYEYPDGSVSYSWSGKQVKPLEEPAA
jgi:hypothetical protein